MDIVNSDWWDELRHPVAAALSALMLLAGAALVGVVIADAYGWIEDAPADAWQLRLFTAACLFAIAYGVFRAVQVSRQSGGGFDVLWKDDDDAK